MTWLPKNSPVAGRIRLWRNKADNYRGGSCLRSGASRGQNASQQRVFGFGFWISRKPRGRRVGGFAEKVCELLPRKLGAEHLINWYFKDLSWRTAGLLLDIVGERCMFC